MAEAPFLASVEATLGDEDDDLDNNFADNDNVVMMRR